MYMVELWWSPEIFVIGSRVYRITRFQDLTGSVKKFTTRFNKFRPKTVSSQLTFTDNVSGSEHLPSTVIVSKQGIELLNISPLNRNRNPDASSRLVPTGMSTDTRKRFALLRTFEAKPSHITRKLSFVAGSTLLSSSTWSVNEHLLQKVKIFIWRILKGERKRTNTHKHNCKKTLLELNAH